MSYDSDILIWSEQQAELLRRLSRGERVNGIDWDNLIEEIESLGRSELHAVESQLRVALTHLLLIAHARQRDPVAHWQAETLAALDNALRGYAPSMAQRIDLAGLWAAAWRIARPKLAADGVDLPKLPDACPFASADLLAEDPDLPVLLARLAA